jgi:hypothetical protein
MRFARTNKEFHKEIHYSLLSHMQLGFCLISCFEIYDAEVNSWIQLFKTHSSVNLFTNTSLQQSLCCLYISTVVITVCCGIVAEV